MSVNKEQKKLKKEIKKNDYSAELYIYNKEKEKSNAAYFAKLDSGNRTSKDVKKTDCRDEVFNSCNKKKNKESSIPASGMVSMYDRNAKHEICDHSKNQSLENMSSKSFTSANNDGYIERDRNKEMDIDNAVKFLLENYNFISLAGKKLFYFNGKYYEEINSIVTAATVLKECLAEQNNRLMNIYREIFHQLLSEREIWVDNMEELPTNEYRIVFQNGTFDVYSKLFYENEFFPEDFMFSMIKFNYDWRHRGKGDTVKRFVFNFCNGDKLKEELLFEILGFVLSNASNKKSVFYLLGVPNAGKSVLCKFIELTVGKELYISIPVKELAGQFNSGELVNKKVCADEDVAVNLPLTSKDLSIIKKISSSDTIQTNSKYKQQGYIRPNCKLLWAGNGMFSFATNEDLEPFAERLVIFPLENSIPREERDPNIIDKLVDERNYIISRALDALHDLVMNQFQFTLVVDSHDYISCKTVVDGIAAFVEEYCILDEEAASTTAVLYDAYETFCDENNSYHKVGKNIFSQRLKKEYSLKDSRTSTTRMIQGIYLK